MDSHAKGARSGRILVVCTGNVCRSPFIERMLRVGIPSSVEVASAGTGALVGRPMELAAAAQVRMHGGDPEGFAARQLTADMVATADLVLTAARAHRAAVALLWPPAVRYAFTLGDLSDLIRGLDVVGVDRDGGPWVGSVARLAADRRGMVPPRSAEQVDIIDPFRREDRIFAAMAEQVLQALPPVVRLLAG